MIFHPEILDVSNKWMPRGFELSNSPSSLVSVESMGEILPEKKWWKPGNLWAVSTAGGSEKPKKRPCVFCRKETLHPPKNTKIPFSHEFDPWKTEMKSYSLFLSLFLNYMLEYETATELCEPRHWPKLECSTGWNPGALKRFQRHGFHWWSLRVPTRYILDDELYRNMIP